MDTEEASKVAYFKCLCKSEHKLLANSLRLQGYKIIKTQHNPTLRKEADSYGLKMPFSVVNGNAIPL